MKLRDYTTDDACRVICEIAPYITNIAIDEELSATIGKAVNPNGEHLTRAGVLLLAAKRITALLPLLLDKHKLDVFNIVGALNGLTAEEVAAQPFPDTAMQVKEIITDEDVIALFQSAK